MWSNNHDGRGRNWLGLQLMLLRDQLSHQMGITELVGQFVDLDTGYPRRGDTTWQELVMAATIMLKRHLNGWSC